MKEILKKIANNNVENAFTAWRAFSPKMPKALKSKIEEDAKSNIKEK